MWPLPVILLASGAGFAAFALASQAGATEAPTPPQGGGGGGSPVPPAGFPPSQNPPPATPTTFVPSGSGGGEGGAAFELSLPKDNSPQREQAILNAVAAGKGIVEFDKIVSQANGHTAEIPVMRRALAIGVPGDALRVSTNFKTAQQIADMLGLMMMTPHVMNLQAQQAPLRTAPHPQQPWVDDFTMSKTKRMGEYSRLMDKHLPDSGQMMMNEGKNWVLTKRYWNDPDLAKRHNGANHGWYPIAGGIIQNRGLKHNMDHVDYSQLLSFMGPIALVDGTPMAIQDMLGSPEFAPLVSDEGTLPGARHPDL